MTSEEHFYKTQTQRTETSRKTLNSLRGSLNIPKSANKTQTCLIASSALHCKWCVNLWTLTVCQHSSHLSSLRNKEVLTSEAMFFIKRISCVQEVETLPLETSKPNSVLLFLNHSSAWPPDNMPCHGFSSISASSPCITACVWRGRVCWDVSLSKGHKSMSSGASNQPDLVSRFPYDRTTWKKERTQSFQWDLHEKICVGLC